MLLLGMEFSDSVVEGVLVAGSAALSESSFHQALESSLRYILEPETSIPQDDEKLSAAHKEALFGICTLLLELARLDVDTASIRSFLEECKFSPERTEHFTSKYLGKKDALRASLERISSEPPNIIDVQWRLDYYLKNNHLESVSRPEYLVNFTTQPNDPKVQFACTQEQLQDLVLKLKDATKTLDKYTQH